jgi:type IV pilus assembly protein PilA
MQNVLASYRKRKKNGGFTLVELIIVIAIMAALVAILAPQYIKYVDKSRRTADQSTADSILSACRVAATEEDVASDFTVEWKNSKDGDDTLEITAGSTDKLKNELAQSLSIKFKKSADSTNLPAKVTPDADETYTVTYSADKGTVTYSGGWWD